MRIDRIGIYQTRSGGEVNIFSVATPEGDTRPSAIAAKGNVIGGETRDYFRNGWVYPHSGVTAEPHPDDAVRYLRASIYSSKDPVGHKEHTSKGVASDAAWILSAGPRLMAEIHRESARLGMPDHMREILRDYQQRAESCAGSALTQRG